MALAVGLVIMGGIKSIARVSDKIVPFISTIAWGPFKVVLLDEAERLSPNAQDSLKGIIEEYSSFARFILTCNYPNKIIPAIHSRCQGFAFHQLDETEFTVRVGQILADEGVDFDVETLTNFVKATYPDLRKAINTAQQYSRGGTLILPSAGSGADTSEWKLEAIALFQNGSIRQGREMICKKIGLEEYEEVYKFLFRNLNFWSDDLDVQDAAIIIIKEGMVSHSMCSDPEINLSATFVELERLYRGE